MADVARPLPLRKRADLATERLTFGRQASWIVKDPLALRFFRFRDEEYAVLEMLDGVRSLGEIRDEFERRFAPQRIRPEDIARFAHQLHEQGLVISDAPDQGPVLWERRRKRSGRERLGRWMNPLAVRFRGIDPQRMLDRMYPWVRPVFSRGALAAAGALMLAALTLVAVRWSEFLAKLPAYDQFFTPSTIVWLMIVLGSVKIVHEFGHGLTCRHFGGDCHELGVMLLVFTPCFYCNVTDAWRFRNKWHRIAVSAAGIYVEVVLASLATFGWWFSAPGLFHQLCLAVMIVCSVTTIVFNGNPLLRYDGYYVLADLVETPNLAEKSAAVFRRFAAQLLGDVPEFDDPLLPPHHRFWYGAYHVASTLYRVVLTFSIILFLLQWTAPYHLENLVRTLGVVTVASMLWGPIRRLRQWLNAPGVRDRLRVPRLVAAGSVAAAFLLAAFFLPLPKRVWGTLEVQPAGTQRVYVDMPGILAEQTVQPGSEVVAGQVIARLENDDLELQIADLKARCGQLQTRIGALERERFERAAAAANLPELRESLAAAEELLRKKESDRERLTLRAERAGRVFPSSDVVPDDAAPPDELPGRGGRPHDPVNLGCTLPEGTLYCEVGDPHRWEALVVVEQADLPFVRVGLPVEVVVEELPEVVFYGEVEEIAGRELTQAPQFLSNKAGGELATETDRSGVERPLTPSYQARVAIDDPHELLRLGLRGTAKIRVAWEPIGTRLARWCARTFHFRL